MVEHGNLCFADTIAVLYQLKSICGFKTLQESYDMFNNQDMDTIITTLRSAYNVANHTQTTEEEFTQILCDNKIGVLKTIELYGNVVQAIMSDGLTPDELQQRKNVLRGL